MTTDDVYRQFGVPKNLQEHMLTVTSLICDIQEYWSGDEIDWDDLIIAGLLHDLGNVIKFDLDKFPKLLGDELPRIDYWRGEQKRLIQKYGNDDHEATGKMLDELGVSERIKEVIQTKSFKNIRNTATLDDWLPKILQYCDLRVSPFGLVTLDERVKDIEERYDKYASRPDFPEMITAAKSIESQIQASLTTDLGQLLDSQALARHEVKLRNYKIIIHAI